MAPTAGGTRHAASSTPHAAGSTLHGAPLPREEKLAQSAFLRACRGQPTTFTPVWLMRQAGRYLPEYRSLRESHSMLDLITTPELAARITLQPLERFDLDAAIIFSDILPPLSGMGLRIGFDPGSGPVIENPIASNRDVDLLAAPPATETLGPTLDAIRIVASELAPRGIPLVGFSGAPFTLASYAVEGGGSKSFAKTKLLMYREPAAWERLMRKLTTVLADFLDSPGGGGGFGRPGVRLMGGRCPGPRRLRAVRPASHKAAFRRAEKRRCHGHQLQHGDGGVHRGGGRCRRRRGRRGLAPSPRRVLEEDRPQPPHPGQPAIPPRCWPPGASCAPESTQSWIRPTGRPGTSSTSAMVCSLRRLWTP